METLKIGTRKEISKNDRTFEITATGSSPKLYAAAITFRTNQQPEIQVFKNETPWRLNIPDDAEAKTEIILYMALETQIGRVEDRGPIRCKIGNLEFQLDHGQEQHGAVIIAEIYTKGNVRYLRARGDGYSFGIKAFARKQLLPIEPFIDEPTFNEAEPEMRRPPRRQRRTSSGSGVIVDNNHIITNAHVVETGQTYTIHGYHGDMPARLIAMDQDNDLALLRVQNQVGKPVKIRKAGSLYLGEPIVALGYPLRDILGEDLKMTHGNISGMKGQRGNVGVFQFTAPIGSGSSGGAITDNNGCLIGIITSALAHDTMRQYGSISENVNFAVKASLVMEMLTSHGITWDETAENISMNGPLVHAIKESIVSISVN